jgi:hypothetical protein
MEIPMFEALWKVLRSTSRRAPAAPPPRRRARPCLEVLEDRLTPAITNMNGQLVITGTSGSDTLSLTTPTWTPTSTNHTLTVTLNGQTSSYDITKIHSISFDGAGGNDFAFLYIDGYYDQFVTLSPGSGTISGLGPDITLNKTANITVQGKANCDATLTGGTGTNTFRGSATTSYLYGAGYYNLVSGFGSVEADGGGSDVAYLTGSSHDDSFSAHFSPISAPDGLLRSDAGSYSIDASAFAHVYASTTGGGSTTAQLTDTSGNTTFTGKAGSAEFSGPALAGFSNPGFDFNVSGFGQVSAWGTASDVANLYDTPAGNAYFVATPSYATLYGTYNQMGYDNQANGFSFVYATATHPSLDTAYFFDSGIGNASFTAMPSSCSQNGSGYDNVAVNFASVYAYGSASDTAYLYDQAGTTSVVLASNYAQMSGSGPGFFVYVSGYGHVYAYATGGTSSITFTDTTGSATFGGTPTWSYMYGSNFYNLDSGFTTVTVNATGQDAAYLYDLPGTGNRFDGSGSSANLSGPGYAINTSGFAAVTVYASQGNTDAAYVGWPSSITYKLWLEGSWRNGLGIL